MTGRRIAEVHSLDHLQALLRSVAEERGMSRVTLDGRAGLADGHSAKLLALIPTKRLGRQTMPGLLNALCVRLILEDDPEALEEAVDELNGRVRRQAHTSRVSMKTKTLSYVNKIANRVVRRHFRELSKRANSARNESLSPEHRVRLAKIAINARWQKYRRERKAAISSPPAPGSKP